MNELIISWEEYHSKIEELARKIYLSGWKFEQIICLAKGGLRIGDILCRLYDVPLAILSVQSYGGEDLRKRGNLTFSDHLSMTTLNLGNKILLVDDLVDSGASLEKTITWLNDHYPNTIKELKTAVIWYKSCSNFAPDYYVDYLRDNPWLVQPFEKYEKMNIQDL
jgi:uncharacterized protein